MAYWKGKGKNIGVQFGRVGLFWSNGECIRFLKVFAYGELSQKNQTCDDGAFILEDVPDFRVQSIVNWFKDEYVSIYIGEEEYRFKN